MLALCLFFFAHRFALRARRSNLPVGSFKEREILCFLPLNRYTTRERTYLHVSYKLALLVFMARVLKQDGNALEWASPRLQKEREVVIAAVQQDWHALKWAAPQLREDRYVVLAAVAQYGILLYAIFLRCATTLGAAPILSFLPLVLGLSPYLQVR